MRRDLARFVVFTTQRTGSTWLMSVLNSLEGVTAQGEIFLPRPRSTERRWDSDFAHPRYVESRSTSGVVRPFSTYRYLNSFFDSTQSVGFKLMYSQLKSYPEILPFLMAKNIDVIHLTRRNHLDVLISFALKREIGLAHVLAAEERPDNPTVELNTDSVLRDIRKLQFKQDVGRRVLRLSRLRHVEVAYEDLVADVDHFERVFRFLNIPFEGAPPESAILKTRVGTRREVVRNYDQVEQALAGSEFSHLLD